MGQAGVDLILSPAAKKILDVSIEAKCVENLNVTTTFWDHFAKYAKLPSLKLLIHRRNHKEALVTLRWQDFCDIVQFDMLPVPNPCKLLRE